MIRNNLLRKILLILGLLCLGFSEAVTVLASESEVTLKKVVIDPSDFPSLQRGAKLFMNHCAGCHSLKYVRYNGMAKDIGIVDRGGQVLEQALKSNLIFNGEKVGDPIQTAMRKEDAIKWFGIAPPDLSLVTKYRGLDWVYTYLHSFYLDDKRPWGVNNTLYPDVAMPHVLYTMQQQLTPEAYDRAIADLVNFLNLMAEPTQKERTHLGVWVLLFLGIFCVFAILLKREYWKDVH